MKTIYIILFSLLSLVTHSDDVHEIEIKINEGSHLYIKGTSNVNTFTCNYLKPIQPQTFTLTYKNQHDAWLLEDAEISLESQSFDCGGRGINKDFEELVKSSEYPSILIHVIEIEPLEANLEAQIKITIAGKTQPVSAKIILEEGEENVYTSELQLNIKDFNLDSPTKLMGLIKVHEKISIHVKLLVEIDP